MPDDPADQPAPDLDPEAPPLARGVLLFIARVVSGIGMLCVALAWAGLLGWLVGEIVSDRFYLTQFLEWVPTPAVLTGSATLLLLGWVFIRFWGVVAGRPARTNRAHAGLRWGWAPWAGLLIYFFTLEAPLVRSRPTPPDPGVDRFRIVFWNASAWYREGWAHGIAAADPDIVILNGLGSTAHPSDLTDSMQGIASVVTVDRFIIISKRPITRYGFTSLGVAAGEGIDPRLGLHASKRADPGYAVFFEVQFPATSKSPGGSTVVQVVDLPSDLSLLRSEVTAKARSTMDAFAGRVYALDSLGRWRPEENGISGKGFPEPGIVIGDFNIPRGADSLRVLSRGYPSAFDQAGRGYMASYPRAWPIVHIDQTFLAPGFRAFNYELRDIGAGSHLIQVIDIARE